jgi:predicted component of type VI protein secretion system
MKTLRLHVAHGTRTATLVFSRFPILIGRDPRAECRLEFPEVSRRHARIDLREGRLTLCDEGSLVGTWVAQRTRRLAPGVVTDFESVGNAFAIGDLELRAELREIGPADDGDEREPSPVVPNVETTCYADADIDPVSLDASALEEALVAALSQREQADGAVADILRQATAIAPAQLARLAQLVVDSDPEWDGHAAVRQFVTVSAVRPEPARVDTTALRALQELAATYVPYGPPLNGIEAVTEFVTRLERVLGALLEGVAALRYGYRAERGAPPSHGPGRAELAAALLDWTHESGALEQLQGELAKMLVHHSQMVGEASTGLERVLARLSPEAIESEPHCRSKWGPWKYKAWWLELRRRAAVVQRLGDSAMGPAFGQVAKALRGRQEIATNAIVAFAEGPVRA